MLRINEDLPSTVSELKDRCGVSTVSQFWHSRRQEMFSRLLDLLNLVDELYLPITQIGLMGANVKEVRDQTLTDRLQQILQQAEIEAETDASLECLYQALPGYYARIAKLLSAAAKRFEEAAIIQATKRHIDFAYKIEKG